MRWQRGSDALVLEKAGGSYRIVLVPFLRVVLLSSGPTSCAQGWIPVGLLARFPVFHALELTSEHIVAARHVARARLEFMEVATPVGDADATATDAMAAEGIAIDTAVTYLATTDFATTSATAAAGNGKSSSSLSPSPRSLESPSASSLSSSSSPPSPSSSPLPSSSLPSSPALKCMKGPPAPAPWLVRPRGMTLQALGEELLATLPSSGAK